MDNKSYKIGIVQLTRFGDLIQTCQAIKSIKSSQVQIETVLICRKQFGAPLETVLSEYFDKIIYFDTKKISSEIINDNLNNSISEINQCVKEINEQNLDVSINLSFCQTSSYLQTLIKATNKLGRQYSPFHQPELNDFVGQYIYSNVVGSNLNTFSLVDLFKRMIGTHKYTNFTSPIKPIKKRLCIHPFASDNRKSWKATKWIDLIYKLLDSDPTFTISIIGGKDDLQNAQSIAASPILERFSSRIENTVSKMEFDAYEEYFKNIDLFIGHDSLGGHLASLYNTPTITISLGMVRPFETTPYGLDNINISPKTKCFPCEPNEECSFYQCHLDIDTSVVKAVIEERLKGNQISLQEIEKNVSSISINSVDIFQTYCVEGINFLCFENINQRENPGVRSIFQNIYFILWGYFVFDQDISTAQATINQQQYLEIKHNLEGVSYLFELCNFGKTYTSYILKSYTEDSKNISTIQEFSNKLIEIDQMIDELKSSYPILKPIIYFHNLKKTNIAGNKVDELSQNLFEVYLEFENMLKVINETLINVINYNQKLKNITIQASNNGDKDGTTTSK